MSYSRLKKGKKLLFERPKFKMKCLGNFLNHFHFCFVLLFSTLIHYLCKQALRTSSHKTCEYLFWTNQIFCITFKIVLWIVNLKLMYKLIMVMFTRKTVSRTTNLRFQKSKDFLTKLLVKKS